jgi:hypothetical protein
MEENLRKHSHWRIPGIRKYAIEFEIDLRSWLIGLTFGDINTGTTRARSPSRSAAGVDVRRQNHIEL